MGNIMKVNELVKMLMVTINTVWDYTRNVFYFPIKMLTIGISLTVLKTKKG